MTRIILKETHESITSWNSLDEVRHWATVNRYPMREENGVLIVESNEFDDEQGGRVPVLCEFRAQEVKDLGGGVLQSVPRSYTFREFPVGRLFYFAELDTQHIVYRKESEETAQPEGQITLVRVTPDTPVVMWPGRAGQGDGGRE